MAVDDVRWFGGTTTGPTGSTNFGITFVRGRPAAEVAALACEVGKGHMEAENAGQQCIATIIDCGGQGAIMLELGGPAPDRARIWWRLSLKGSGSRKVLFRPANRVVHRGT
ncbi:hypothetical protein GCM10022248_45680 [Nonomuraea soli]